MEHQSVLVIGSGHLAARVSKVSSDIGHTVTHLTTEELGLEQSVNISLGDIETVLKGTNLTSFGMIYVLDESDEYNLEIIVILISLYEDLPITASLFNENIAPHLGAAHPNIRILNPARIAAPAFVTALDTPLRRTLRYAPAPVQQLFSRPVIDHLLTKLVLVFAALIFVSILYFHIFENLSYINSAYFVIVTISTVGYGDINMMNASTISKIVDIILILCSTVFVWMIFSLTIDHIIKKRIQLSLGRKKYSYSNHVIVCGLGRLGYFVVEELLARGETVVVIESNENTPSINYFRSRGVNVYIGNARLLSVLQDVNVAQAQAIISVISNDYVNLEIGLNARSIRPDLRLVLRIYDKSMADKIRENLDINLTFSMSALADRAFLDMLGK